MSKSDKPAYLKIDVVKAFEDEELREEFGIPTRKVYSGDLCPDHMGIMVLKDAITWAEELKAGMLIIESAGLCLRCTLYTTQAFGIAVLPAVSGSNSPLKMAPLIALADAAVVTKTDLVSQAEKEVFRECIRSVVPKIDIIETNAVQGTGSGTCSRRSANILISAMRRPSRCGARRRSGSAPSVSARKTSGGSTTSA